MTKRSQKSSIIVAIVLVVALAVFAYIFFSPESSDEERPLEPATSETNLLQKSSEAPVVEVPDREVQISTEESKEAGLVALLDRPVSNEQLEWKASHGYYKDLPDQTGFVEPTHSYNSLDNNSLDQLVASGDMVAAAILGDRLMMSLDPASVQSGLDYHEDAVSLGSTYSALVLGGHYVGTNKATDDPDSSADRLKEGLAWWLVAAGFGDPAGNLSFYLQTKDVNIAPDFLAEVCDRAGSLRAEVGNQRREQGLDALPTIPMPGYEDIQGTTPASFSNPCRAQPN